MLDKKVIIEKELKELRLKEQEYESERRGLKNAIDKRDEAIENYREYTRTHDIVEQTKQLKKI